jgi:hypothetical protein
VDAPAGSVVIGGDASNDALAPPRAHSTSDQVERLAKGADIVVHSTMHPILGPDQGSGFLERLAERMRRDGQARCPRPAYPDSHFQSADAAR